MLADGLQQSEKKQWFVHIFHKKYPIPVGIVQLASYEKRVHKMQLRWCWHKRSRVCFDIDMLFAFSPGLTYLNSFKECSKSVLAMSSFVQHSGVVISGSKKKTAKATTSIFTL